MPPPITVAVDAHPDAITGPSLPVGSSAIIYCERDGQKAILIGKGGQKLKEMGMSARLELERRLGKKVFLELFVKVKAGWRQSEAFVDELDWRRQLS